MAIPSSNQKFQHVELLLTAVETLHLPFGLVDSGSDVETRGTAYAGLDIALSLSIYLILRYTHGKTLFVCFPFFPPTKTDESPMYGTRTSTSSASAFPPSSSSSSERPSIFYTEQRKVAPRSTINFDKTVTMFSATLERERELNCQRETCSRVVTRHS